jgi:hypothetical protein
MFDLQGTSLYSRYCVTGNKDVVTVGSISSASIIRDAAGQVVSQKSTPTTITGLTTCASGRQGSEFAYDEIKNLKSGVTYVLSVTAQSGGSPFSLTKTFTTTGGSTPATESEAIIPTGLGGYAVIHPDGHVCGVIVGNSYFAGNDKTMNASYMGCPVGSRIIFQTRPSPSGNVAGWHGADVTYSGGVFRLSNGTTISNGLATDANGRVWDTGSGVTIKAGTVTTNPQTDTKTATTQTDTKTATTQTDTKTATTSVLVAADTSTATVLQLTSLSISEKEDLLKVTLKSNKSSTINISVDIPKVSLVVRATKKDSAPITFKVKTDAEGDAQIKTNKNLTGFTVTLSVGKVKLDSDLIRK